MKYYLFNVNSEQYSLSSNYHGISYELIGNTEGGITETILFAPNFSIPKIALRI